MDFARKVCGCVICIASHIPFQIQNMKSLKLLLGLIISISSASCLQSATFYVDAENPTPAAPFTTWTTAATNIQDAIAVATKGDTVLVTNGVYAFGGAVKAGDLVNRVALTNALTVQSVNGPWVTAILGAGATNGPAAVRCAWLTNGASLVGFTLAYGATRTTGDSPTLQSGGGVWCMSSNAFVVNCVIVSNAANSYGGGAYQGTITGSLINGNRGGTISTYAVYGSVLNNCTIVSNIVGGVRNLNAMTNCIVYNNSFGNYLVPGTACSHCCTTPALTGTGNFTNAPQLAADGIRLTSGSPCIGTGTGNVSGTDIFGLAWSSPPSVGCAEWQPSPMVTPPQVRLATYPIGFSIGNAAVFGATPVSYAWLRNGLPLQDNGHFSSTQSSNLLAVGVTYGDAGNYQLVVSNSFGVVTSAVAQVIIHCADVASQNPMAPYTAWSTAATNIQDAIDAANPGEIVLVTNGVYSAGGLVMAGDLTNRVALNKAIIVASVNGYQSTIIQGAWDPVSTNGPGAVRCAWLTNGAALNGFTLQNGATRSTGDGGFLGGGLESGGGVWCISTNEVVSNCVLTNNSANFGGGAVYGTLANSLIVGNTAREGGGVLYSALNNCTVVNNYVTSGSGGGTYSATVKNSIVVGNYQQTPPFFSTTDNYYPSSSPQYYNSCSSGSIGTPPLSTNLGNINSSDPKFLDLFHISTISPCYGTASNTNAAGWDLDGEPWNNPPSMGCDEVVISNLVGPLSVTIFPGWTNGLVNRPLPYLATITGRAANATWSFGDGPVYTNFGNGSVHTWTNGGDYTVAITVYNNDNPLGVSGNLLVHVEPLLATQLQSPALLTNGFSFQFPVQYLANYTVQYATNLVPPITWQTLQTIYFHNQSNNQVLDSTWTDGARFYRVLTQ
jgi:hypothetical protein